MAILLSYLDVPLSWREILKRTFKEALYKDNVLGMAAELAYYFFFALFPALLFLLALASYFPIDTLVDDIVRMMGGFAPSEVLAIITDQIRKISEGKEGGLLTFGVVAALWSSSAAMTSIIDTLNRAYDIEEGRPWWKVRLVAIGLTTGVALFILVSFALIIVGPTLAERIAAWMHLGPAFVWAWKILQWPVVFALASSGIAFIYYFAPDAEQDWVWLTPGSIFATIVWMIVSLAFKYYVTSVGGYTEAYGAIGGVMILMLWFYISGLAILLGAEMNAEIEHASPHGKEPGEKVPGQKRRIGPAALRAWRERHKGQRERPPSADEEKKALEPAAAASTRVPAPALAARPALISAEATAASPRRIRMTDWLIGGAVLAAQIWWAARSFHARRHA